MENIERERTFLAKNLPQDILKHRSKEIVDVYFYNNDIASRFRLRKNGTSYEMTKKFITDPSDVSTQIEQTITLSETEFYLFNKIPGKRLRKIRYYYPHDDVTAEFDVFQDELQGLVLVEFEFRTIEEFESFKQPDFCLVEVTQEDFIAGVNLAGSSYHDIENTLNSFNYRTLGL